MGQAFTKEEIARFNAVAEKVRTHLKDYKGTYYLKYDREFEMRGDDVQESRFAISVHVPSSECKKVKKLLPKSIDGIVITTDWIDPIRQQDGYYDKTHYEPEPEPEPRQRQEPRQRPIPLSPSRPPPRRRSPRLEVNSPLPVLPCKRKATDE
jgi:hypothetical protein